VGLLTGANFAGPGQLWLWRNSLGHQCHRVRPLVLLSTLAAPSRAATPARRPAFRTRAGHRRLDRIGWYSSSWTTCTSFNTASFQPHRCHHPAPVQTRVDRGGPPYPQSPSWLSRAP
jgi:hypothetical protein